MPPHGDLVDSLRSIEAHFASLAPRPHVVMALRARLRRDLDASRGPFGGFGLRVGRPLALALALAGIALAFHGERTDRARPDESPNPTASESSPAPLPNEERPTDAPRDEAPRRVPIHHLDTSLPRLLIHGATMPRVAPANTPMWPPFEPEAPTGSAPELMHVHGGPGGALVPALRETASGPSRERRSVSSVPAPTARPPSAPPSPPPIAPAGDDANAKCQSMDQWVQEADRRCKERGQALERATFVGSCADGRYLAVAEQCTDGGSSPAQKCAAVVLGDGQSCVDDGQLKTLAVEACSGPTLTSLIDLSFTGDCTDGYAKSAKVLCCDEPSNQEVCPVAVVGNGQECMDSAQIGVLAAAACGALGPLVPNDVSLGSDCPDGRSTTAKVSCCAKGSIPPPPPPPMQNEGNCAVTVVGPGTSCVDPSEMETLATEACSAQGPFEVTDISPFEDCGGGASTSAKVTCCMP